MARYKAKVLLEIESESWGKDALNHRWAELMRLGMKLFGPGFKETLPPEWEEMESVSQERTSKFDV